MELTEDDWDAIIGRYRRAPVDDVCAIWHLLKELAPLESYHSLHCKEEIYLLDNVRYSCIWELSSACDIPYSIEIQATRERISPIQLDLF